MCNSPIAFSCTLIIRIYAFGAIFSSPPYIDPCISLLSVSEHGPFPSEGCSLRVSRPAVYLLQNPCVTVIKNVCNKVSASDSNIFAFV